MATATAAPPPATPSTAPATPPVTPSPTPPSAPSTQDGGDPFAAMDARIMSRRQTSAPKEPVKPPTEPAGKPTGAEPAAAAPEPAKVPDKPVVPQKPADPRQLREQLQKVSKEWDTAKGRVTELEAKIADYEKRGIDTTALTERLAAREKEVAELQHQVRAFRREKSPEFIQKYDVPFNQSADYAKREVEQLSIVGVQNEAGETVQAERPAKWDDFVQLFHMPKGKAIQVAQQLFGPASGEVLNYLSELKKMDFTRKQALDAEMKSYQDSINADVERSNKEREFISSQWMNVNKDIAEKNKDWYGESKDTEDNAIFNDALQVIDSRLNGTLTPQQKIVHDAQVRLRAAAAPRLAYRLEKSNARIAELEAALAEAQGSKPGATRRATGSAAPNTETTSSQGKPWKQDLREHMAQG